MSKEDVINYVMTTPGNPNKAVLEGMLDGMGGADVPAPTAEDAGKVLGVNESGSYALVEQSGSDCGYECAEVQAVLTDETVTTIKATESSPSASASLYYSELIDADEITLTLDGTEYALQRQATGSGNLYKGQNELPTVYSSAQYGNSVSTQNAGTYSVKIEAPSHSVETTDCFKEAVRSLIPSEEVVVFDITQTGESSWTPSISATEMYEQMATGHKTYVGAMGSIRFFPMQTYDAEYGMTGVRFGRLFLDGTQVKLEIYAFTSTDGSSHEIMTFSIQ